MKTTCSQTQKSHWTSAGPRWHRRSTDSPSFTRTPPTNPKVKSCQMERFVDKSTHPKNCRRMQAGERWKSSFRFTDTFCHTLTIPMFIMSCHCIAESTQQTRRKDCQHNCRPQSVESNIKDQTLRQIRLLRSFQLAQLSIVNCQQRAGDATHALCSTLIRRSL